MESTPKAYAMRLLAQRSYTAADLRRKLVHKKFSFEDSDATVTSLAESGLVNDKSYALSFARSKLSSGDSPRRIRQALARKGIPASVSDEALCSVIIDEEIDLQESIERVARKKLALISGLDRLVARRRLVGFLGRRGYDIAEIRRITDKLIP
jgi:regulatory protein